MSNEKFNLNLPVVPDVSLGTFPQTTQTHTKTFVGLPPKAKGQLVDKLFRVFSKHGLRNEAGIIKAFVVPANGKLTFSGLRDSMYDLIITTPGLSRYNQLGVSIGDPENFNTVNTFDDPAAAQIVSVISSSEDGDTPYAKVTWELAAVGQTGIFSVDYKETSSSTWITYLDGIGPNTRTLTVSSLKYSTSYDFRLITHTADGGTRGISSKVTITTVASPAEIVQWTAVLGTEAVVQLSGGSLITMGGTSATVDNINDGVTYKRVDATALTNNKVDLGKTGVLGKTGANITYTVGGLTLDDLKPAESGADVTSTHEAATIAGQGALATQDSVDFSGGEVTNKLASYVTYADTSTVESLQPAEANATVGATIGTNLYKSGGGVANALSDLDPTSATKLGTIEEGADVTDATNVGAIVDKTFVDALNVVAASIVDQGGLATQDRTDLDYTDGADVTADNEAATVASLAGHDADDLAASATRFWAGEDGADVTDATNVASAGALMDGDFSSNGLLERTGAGAYTVMSKALSSLDTTAYNINKSIRSLYTSSSEGSTAALVVHTTQSTSFTTFVEFTYVHDSTDAAIVWQAYAKAATGAGGGVMRIEILTMGNSSQGTADATLPGNNTFSNKKATLTMSTIVPALTDQELYKVRILIKNDDGVGYDTSMQGGVCYVTK